jgi:hypothetical protein
MAGGAPVSSRATIALRNSHEARSVVYMAAEGASAADDGDEFSAGRDSSERRSRAGPA